MSYENFEPSGHDDLVQSLELERFRSNVIDKVNTMSQQQLQFIKAICDDVDNYMAFFKVLRGREKVKDDK